jgi:hypothetical protein
MPFDNHMTSINGNPLPVPTVRLSYSFGQRSYLTDKLPGYISGDLSHVEP